MCCEDEEEKGKETVRKYKIMQKGRKERVVRDRYCRQKNTYI